MSDTPEVQPTVTVSFEPAQPTLLAQHQARGALTLLRNAQDGHPTMKNEVAALRRAIAAIFRLEE